MDAPTAADVREVAKLDFAGLGYPAGSPDDLDLIVEMAVAYVEQMTGRTFASMPPELEPLALQAVTMRTEQLVYYNQADFVEASVNDRIQSFSVPGYSETRAAGATASYKMGLVNPWVALHELLWLLMTPEAKEEWQNVVMGRDAPAFEVSEVDWAAVYTSGYGYYFS